MIQSRGTLVKGYTTLWEGTPGTWGGWPSGSPHPAYTTGYAEMYRTQQWVATLVDKRASLLSRLPLKVYERDDLNRPEATGHAYWELWRRPSTRWSRRFLVLWLSSVFDNYGEVFAAIVRDRGGRPVELMPLHPTAMHVDDEKNGGLLWRFEGGKVRITGIPDHDLIHLKTFNPESAVRGLSKLEPLRRTLESEDFAQRATSAQWRNGNRPSVLLEHPKQLTKEAGERLRVQWDSIHRGADNYGKTAILEEGMKPHVVQLSAEQAQYIETRKLNREEVCARYDVPPPVVHILDRATFSNITEQMRSMYRDTMAPHLGGFQDEFEFQLRGGLNPVLGEPNFGDEVYAEFLLDEVLRGDFEKQIEAETHAVQFGIMTPAEVRKLKNLPFVEGSDRLFINSTMVPLDAAAQQNAAAEQVAEEAVRALMGRLSRQKSLDEVDPASLVAGMGGEAPAVLAALESAKAERLTVAQFRGRLRAMAKEDG